MPHQYDFPNGVRPVSGIAAVGIVTRHGTKLEQTKAGDPMLRFILTVTGHYRRDGSGAKQPVYINIEWRKFTFRPEAGDFLKVFGMPELKSAYAKAIDRQQAYLNLFLYGDDVELVAQPKSRAQRSSGRSEQP